MILIGYEVVYAFFFFFKQKTAYEMRISDWSSDVCSSDLLPCKNRAGLGPGLLRRDQLGLRGRIGLLRVDIFDERGFAGAVAEFGEPHPFACLLDAAPLQRSEAGLGGFQFALSIANFALCVEDVILRSGTRPGHPHTGPQ